MKTKKSIPKGSCFLQMKFQHTQCTPYRRRWQQNPQDTLINLVVLLHILSPHQPIPSSAHCYDIRRENCIQGVIFKLLKSVFGGTSKEPSPRSSRCTNNHVYISNSSFMHFLASTPWSKILQKGLTCGYTWSYCFPHIIHTFSKPNHLLL